MTTVEERLRSLADQRPIPPSVTAVMTRGAQLGRRRKARRIVAGTVLAIALIVWPVVSLGGLTPASRSQASVFLTEMAARAGSQPGVDVAGAAYWYARTDVTYGSLRYTREVWLGHHVPGKLIQPDGIIGTTTLPAATFAAGSVGITWDGLLALPTDTNELYAWMKNAAGGAGHDPDSEVFVEFGDLLRESPAPSALRRALYLVAAKIPDVTLTTGLHDALGRPATAVSRPAPEGVGLVRYFIDNKTGAFLEEQDINADGTVAIQETLVVSGPVASTSVRQ